MKKLRGRLNKIFLTIALLSASVVQGQDMLGVAFSIYSGISAAGLNPALLTGTRVYIDVNILTGDFSFANDMIYFSPENRTIRRAIRLDPNIFSNGRFNWGRSFNYYRNTNDKYLTSSIKQIGPSLMVQADRHAFGFSTSFRSFNSGNQIPYSMPVLIYEGLSYSPYHGVERNDSDYSFVSLAWMEIGLSYAYNFFDLYSNRFTLGVTLKGLLGYQGGYIDMRNANYTVLDSRSVDFKNVDADIAFALPVEYGDELTLNNNPLFKGYGLGLDVGIVYTKLKSTLVYERDDKLCARPYNDYHYKIGLSIMDIGSILFTENAQLHRFDNVSKEWIDFDTIQFNGIQNLMDTYSYGFYGNPKASLYDTRLRVGLPATVSLQFDYHIRPRLYIAALWMHPIRFNSRTLWRPPQLAVVPRYENRMIGVSLPVSLFNYRDPRVGIALRIYTLTVGTDRLGSLLGVSNFNGMDFYFSFRFNIGKGACSTFQKDACSNRNFGNKY